MPTYLAPGVYVEEMPSGSMPLSAVGTAVPAFIGYTQKAPTDDPTDLKPRMVTSWAQYKRHYGEFTERALLPYAVRGFFQNGGGRCYIVRIPDRTVGQKAIESPKGAGADQKALAEFISLVEDGEVTVEIKLSPPPESKTEKPDKPVKPTKSDSGSAPAEKPDAPLFDVEVKHGDVTEKYTGLSLGSARKKNVVTEINSRSLLIEVVGHVDDPKQGLSPQTIKLSPPEALDVVVKNFEGDEDDRTGVSGLTIAEDVTMVLVPDLHTAAMAGGTFKPDLFEGVQKAVIAHCENERNRMAILDTPRGLSPSDALEWRDRLGDTKFSTLYYPWLKVDNPAATNGNKTILVPPSGHMAGIWARTDNTRGVWKAPANESVLGVLNVETQITTGEQETLNPEGVNAIRSFGSRGLKVWGARTLSSTDPSWKYINVRRLFNMVESTIMEGTQWVVFEPNDQALWQRVSRTVNAFLLGLWRDGALFGATPEEAFMVKCDRETNTEESINEGKLIVEVGIAPVKPAEFVIFRMSQKSLASAK